MASRRSFSALIVRDVEHKPWIALNHGQEHARWPGWLSPSLFPVPKSFHRHTDEIGEHLLSGTNASSRAQPN
jgi:hypothetical protein